MRALQAISTAACRALARLRIAIALRRDRGLRYDWRRAWRGREDVGMTTAARTLLAHTAELLDREATTIRRMHTRPPEFRRWPDDAHQARNDHDDLVMTAMQLRNLATQLQ